MNNQGGMRTTTSIALANENGTYTVEVEQTEMEIGAVIDELLIPVLCAAGYHQQSVEKMFADGGQVED